MNWLPGPETRAAVLKHPFVLAGCAVVALLGLVAAALVVVDSVRGGSSIGVPTVVVESSTLTPGPTSRTAIAGGVTGTAIEVTTVRESPGARTRPLGTLNKGDDVAIDGKTTDAKWYRVIFPPNSELHGWIDATQLSVTGDPARLVVATAEPPVAVDIPTPTSSQLTAAAGQTSPTPESTLTVTVTPPGGLLPDLVIGTTPTVSDGKLFVTVVNQGKGDAVGDLVVAVFSADGTKLLGGATLPKFTLKPGRSIDIGTGYEVTGSETLLLIVDPNGDIPETDDTNNRVSIAISVGGPDATTSAVPSETPAAEPSQTPVP
jgi:hypothetical protein